MRGITLVASLAFFCTAIAAQTGPFTLTDELTPRASAMQVVDMDADGDADFQVLPLATAVNDGHGRMTIGPVTALLCGLLWPQPYNLSSNGVGIADFNGDGLPDLIDGGSTGTAYLYPGLPGGGFFPGYGTYCPPSGVAVAIGGSPQTGGNFAYSFAPGDVDGDGDQDVVVGATYYGSVPTAPVLLRNIGGTLSMETGAASGFTTAAPCFVELDDLDGDGWLDLVAVGGPLGGAAVLQNLGGTFAPPVTLPTPGLGTWLSNTHNWPRPVVADLDGDGLKEIFVRQGPQGNSLLLRQTAPFAFAVVATLPGYGADPTLPIGVTAGDFDGDGVAELALATSAGVTFSSLVGGALVPDGPTIPRVFVGLFAAEADQDGDVDLFATVYTQPGGFENETGFNDGSGTFVFPGRAIAALPWTAAYDKGDFDGDGDLDLVGYRATVPDGSATAPFVALNRGDGTFAPSTDLPCVGCPPVGYGFKSGFLVASFNPPFRPTAKVFDSDLDGDLDLVVIRTGDPTGATDVWLRNDGPAGFVAIPLAPPPTVLKTGHAFVATDLDGDGDRDLVFTATPASAFVRYNLGASFGPSLVLPVPFPVSDVAADDLDGDGDPDLVFPRQDAPTFGWFVLQNHLQQGGALTAGGSAASGQIWHIVLADLNGDGKPDVVGSNGLRWLNLGGFAFGPSAPVLPSAPTSYFTAACDFEGDGDLDLFANYGYHARNDGSGVFTTADNGPLVSEPLCVADFDFDGDSDVVMAGPTMLAGRARQLSLRRPARPGRPAGFDVIGPAFGGWIVAAQLAPATFASVATPFGGLAIDPGLATILEVGLLDAAGTAVFEATLPSSPAAALVGAEFLFQAVVGGPEGTRLTNPRFMKVLDY